MIGTFDMNHILIVFFSITFLASVALALAINLFGREEVLFGEVSSFGLTFKRSNIRPKTLPEKPESLFFAVVALIFFLYVCVPLQSWDLVFGLLFTQVVGFFLLPVGFAYYLKLDLSETFRLRMPALQFVVIVLVFFLGIQLTISTILYVQNQIFPMPKGLLESLEKLTKLAQSYPFPLVLLVVAGLPAICEELTFRGLILSGLLNRSSRWNAVILTAALFAIFHVSLHRFLPAFLIGLAAGFLVIYSRSLLPAMLLHFLHNGWIAAAGYYPSWDVLHLLEPKPSLTTFLIGAVLIALGSYWLKRPTKTKLF
jgi:sodium transport system permease protein